MQGSLMNSAQRWLKSTLRPASQTSCHIWRSAELASARCGWASTAADLGFRTNRFAGRPCQMAPVGKMRSLVDLSRLLSSYNFGGKRGN